MESVEDMILYMIWKWWEGLLEIRGDEKDHWSTFIKWQGVEGLETRGDGGAASGGHEYEGDDRISCNDEGD